MYPDRLVRRLRGNDPGDAFDAAEALGRLGLAATRVLSSALDDARPGFRVAALAGLGRLKHPGEPVVAAVLGCLEDPDRDVRVQACLTLALLRPTSGTAVAALTGILASDDRGLVNLAAHALHEIGPAARRATAALIDVIRRFPLAESYTAYEAVMALAAIASPDERHVPTLVGLLELDEPHFVKAGVNALGAYGPTALAAVPQLRRLLTSDIPDVRFEAAFALAKITDDDEPVEILIGLAVARNSDMRTLALICLADLGGRAAQAIPRLRSLLEDPEPGIGAATVRLSAAIALARIDDDDDESIETLIGLAVAGNIFMRLQTLESLADLGGRAARAVPRLRSLLEDPDPEIRAAANTAIEKIGRGAPGSGP